MPLNILKTAGQTHTAYLHPGGEVATKKLIQWLDLHPGQKALEIGCGTGATALQLAQTSHVHVVAFDKLPDMLVAAQDRFRQASHVSLRLVNADISASFPFPTSTFDAVYAESVLAIVDSLHAIRESARVIRFGGRFVFNERIWKPGVSLEEVTRINALSIRFFGIPAATANPWHKNDWMAQLHIAGLDDLLPPRYAQRLNLHERLIHARAHLVHPITYLHNLKYRFWSKRYKALWTKLESVLFFGTRRPKS